jgi:acetyl esterase/lipase
MTLRLPRLLGCLLGSFITATAFAADAPATPKPATKVPAGVRAVTDAEYVAGGGPAQSLDLFLPEKQSDKPLPMVVWIHGGGWKAGNRYNPPGLDLVKNGYAVASIEYRFSNVAVFPAQIQDCQAAIRWLRANAKQYNLDASRIGVWGASAGGHLVALLDVTGGKKLFPAIGGNEDQSDKVQAVVDIFGPTDFHNVMAQAAAQETKSVIKWNTPDDPYSLLIGVKLGEDEAKEQAVSPLHYVSADAAPILIVHGTTDALVPLAQSQSFYDALKKAGVDTTLQVMPGSGHGGPAYSLPAVSALEKAFFDKHLKGTDVKIEPLPAEAVTVKPAAKPAASVK